MSFKEIHMLKEYLETEENLQSNIEAQRCEQKHKSNESVSFLYRKEEITLNVTYRRFSL